MPAMPSEKVIELRRHLREKFPAAHRFGSLAHPLATATPQAAAIARPSPHSSFLPASAPWPLLPPPGTLAELAGGGPGSGLSLVIASLLATRDFPGAPSTERPLALIDARDSFDPASFAPDQCARLLWVRCRETGDALRAADLLLRDGNLPLVVLDLAGLPARELRRIPLATWHRLRQLAASTATTLLALTPTPSILPAQSRHHLAPSLRLHHLDLPEPPAIHQAWPINHSRSRTGDS